MASVRCASLTVVHRGNSTLVYDLATVNSAIHHPVITCLQPVDDSTFQVRCYVGQYDAAILL